MCPRNIAWTSKVTLTTHSCICTVAETTRRPPSIHSKACITDVGQWMSANRQKLNTDKTELLWAGPSQSSLTGCGPSLQLEADTVTPQDDVRLLGVTISSDPSLQRHVSNVSTTSFYWLRQLRRVRRSLDWVSGYTCSRIRHLPSGPVQCRTFRSHEVSHRHAAVCYEGCRTCRQ